MNLPKPNIPVFFTELISTNKKHKFRPYTVAEQEALLIALEGSNQLEIINACETLINNCVEGVDASKLPSFDFEYLFLKLRIASSGEIVELSVSHDSDECDHSQNIELNLNDIKIRKSDKHTKKIDITSEIGVVMKYPGFSDVAFKDSKELLISCIESIYDSENNYLAKDFSNEELMSWIGDLENKHLLKIKEFFDTMPKIYLELNWKCSKCGKSETKVIEDFTDFFS